MRIILTLMLLVSIVLSVNAIDVAKNSRPQVKSQRIDFNKPTTEFQKNLIPTLQISAAPTTQFASAADKAAVQESSAQQGPNKVVVADDGIIYVTAEKFAYVEQFEGGWFMSMFTDEQDDGDYFMFKFHFNNPTDSPAGHYTSIKDDLLRLNYGHSESAQLDTIRYQSIDMVVTEDEDGALKMEGDMWGKIIKHDDYGNVVSEGKVQQYHFLITQPAPIKPKEEKNLDIVCNPADCILYGSENLFFGKDNASGLYAQVALKGGLSGEFDKDHIMSDYTLVCSDAQGSNAIGIAEQQSATVTLANNKDFDINTTFVGTDSIRYNIHMTLTLPDGGTPTEVKITNAQAQSFWGYFMASGYNEDYQAQVSGTLRMGPVEDFSTLSAYVAETGAEYASYALFFHDAELSEDENGQLVVTCSFYANDYKEYKLDMRYIVGEPVDNIDITCLNSEYINALEAEQAQRLNGESTDGRYSVQITMLGTETTEGTFAINGSDAWGYVYDNEKGRRLSFLNGETVVTMDENKHIVCTISADGMDIDVHHFNITMEGEWDDAYLEKKQYDAQEGELDAAFFPTDEVTMENHINDGGYLYVNIRSDERKELLTLVIYAPKKDKNIFIPAGTYTIEDTEDIYTIQPSPGVYDNTIYPSYYANLTDDGYLTTPLWMLERGTMTVKNVDNQLQFVIDAVNSYKRPIHITYNMETDGISTVETNTNAKVRKFIENGRVVISKNFKRYNTLGAEMK